ncbi:hypothetical protein [Archangium sp.]|uniref:hypothetical protein n=1 Tax=Archangium sp. TaxID=1872627 RepID=UPI002D53AE84|nr:hypothetical protein [Archangium sp.]HYO59404.1 hypothetical protein [Archangium sp.]
MDSGAPVKHQVCCWPGTRLDRGGHTTATLLLKAGVPLATVQRILRHSDPAITTEVYGHLDLDDMRKGLNQFAFQTARVPEAPELAPALAAGGEPPPLAAGLLLEGSGGKTKALEFQRKSAKPQGF